MESPAVAPFIEPGVLRCLGRISVPHIDPASAGWFQHTQGLIEDIAQLLNVCVHRRFQSELAFHMVIPKLPVRRRGDEAIDRLWRHRFQNSPGVSLDDSIEFDVDLLLAAPVPKENAIRAV